MRIKLEIRAGENPLPREPENPFRDRHAMKL